MTPSSVSEIHDLVRAGRITPDQGAMLLELRQRLLWVRRPWWERAMIIVWRMLWSW